MNLMNDELGSENNSSSTVHRSSFICQKFPPQSSCPQSQSSSIVSPVPSHEALQYLLPSVAGQLHGGFLHLFLSLSSAILNLPPLNFELPIVCRTLAQTMTGLEVGQRAVGHLTL